MPTFGILNRLVLTAAVAVMAVSSARSEPVKLDDPEMIKLYDAAVAAGETELVYYTASRNEEAKALGELWSANFPKIALTLVGKQAPEVITQVEAEKAAGQLRADVVTMTQPYVAQIWKQKGYYEPYKVSSFDKIAKGYADPDGTYYSSGVYLLTIAYNTTAYTDKSQLPHTFNDFLDPKFKGKIIIAHPSTSGNSLTYFMNLIESGKVDWAYLEKLAKQDVMFVRGASEAARSVASGERPISPIISSFNILIAKQAGQKIDLAGLDDGTQVAEQPSGIMAGAAHPNAAKLMLELLTSAKGQEVLTGAGKYWPTNVDAKMVEGMPALESLNPVSLSFATPQDQAVQDFLKRFDTAFGRE
ncbi:MAG: extracellular solute-binding protein [Rhizobiaceae bacterium]|nr:extracellular solute-binding protein [Rhizobiaceae bacterium]